MGWMVRWPDGWRGEEGAAEPRPGRRRRELGCPGWWV